MPFTIQPTKELLQSDKSIFFEFDLTVASSEVTPNVESELTINGSVIQKNQIHHPIGAPIVGGGGSIHTYKYEIELSGRISKYFADVDNLINDRDTGGVTKSGNDTTAEFSIRVQGITDDGQGFLEESGSWTTSDTKYAIKSALPPEVVQNFDAFMDTIPTGLTRFFTTKPDKSKVRLDDNEYLGFWGEGIGDTLYVESYDSNGTIITTAKKNLGKGAAKEQVVVGIGPANLAATSWDSGGVPSTNNWHSYSIEVTEDSRSERREYFILRDNCPYLRIHFINQYGVQDSLTVTDFSYTREVGSEIFERGLPNNYVELGDSARRLLRGIAKHRVRSIKVVECRLHSLQPAQYDWLTILLDSPGIMIEVDGNYAPGVLRDSTFNLDDSKKENRDLTFEILFSNPHYSQIA